MHAAGARRATKEAAKEAAKEVAMPPTALPAVPAVGSRRASKEAAKDAEKATTETAILATSGSNGTNAAAVSRATATGLRPIVLCSPERQR